MRFNIHDFIRQPEDPYYLNALCLQLRKRPRAEMLRFILDLAEADIDAALDVAYRCHLRRREMESLFRHGLQVGDVSSVRRFVEMGLARLGFGPVMRLLEEALPRYREEVCGALFWMRREMDFDDGQLRRLLELQEKLAAQEP